MYIAKPTSPSGLSVLRFIPANLQKLHVAGLIGSNALFLGLQLIARMQLESNPRISATMREANTIAVEINGRLYAGPLDLSDRLHCIAAMQELQEFAGLYSNLSIPLVMDTHQHSGHFSNQPDVVFGDDWDYDSRIHFLFRTEEWEYWCGYASTVLEQQRSSCTILQIHTKE